MAHFPTGFPTSFPSGFPTSFPSGTTVTYVVTATSSPSYTPNPNPNYPPGTGGSGNETDSGSPPPQHHNFWDKLALGAKAGILAAIVISAIIVLAIAIWYCCGCCGLRKARARRNAIRRPSAGSDTMPLSDRQGNSRTLVYTPTIPVSTSPPPMREAPPPLYTENTPPQHTSIQGGITHARDEEAAGVVSDGKTPLSEIPFEDVVLNTPASASSARSFGDTHLGHGGDTTGHTNS